MHIIVTAIGSAGDINPMLMIAGGLHERGHEVDFIANGHFQEKVNRAGLNFLALGGAELYQKALDHPEIWKPRTAFDAVWRTLSESIDLSVQLIESRLRTGTILVGSTLAMGSRIAQEKHKVKGSTVHLSPSCIISARDPMAMPGLPFFPSLPLFMREKFMSNIDQFWLDKVCKDDLNKIRQGHGLPPVESVMRAWVHSPDQVICGFPGWYAQPQTDWPPNVVLIGFPIYNRPEDQALAPKLEEFLSAGDPPAVFTAGSAMAHAKKHFETAVAASQLAGMRAVLVSAYAEQVPAKLPDNVVYVRYAPFSVLFPRASVVQHHGGIGTSAQALKAGIPHLVTPFAHDQFDNAYRLAKLGVARQESRPDRKAWARVLVMLRQSDAVELACHRAKILVREAQSPVDLAADAIESLQNSRILF